MNFKRTLLALLSLFIFGCNSAPTKPSPDDPKNPPKLLAPSIRKVWIPPHLKDGGMEWEEGHFTYKIERNSSWSR